MGELSLLPFAGRPISMIATAMIIFTWRSQCLESSLRCQEAAVKVTKEKSAENRAALINTAARMFRERGVDGVGVAEISKAAGLTHGALYAQFPSKQALAAEALAHGLARSHASMTAPKPHGAPTLSDHLDLYLSLDHRDNLADGCAMAASASE